MCSARIQEEFVLHAFMKGAPMVLVSGCHFADCHYINANRATVRRVLRLWDKMEKLKIRPERLQLEWISAAEGQKFAAVMRKLDEKRKDVTSKEVEYTIEAIKADKLKGAAKKAAMSKLISPRPPELIDNLPPTNGKSNFRCMSCDNIFSMRYDAKAEPFEWSCPKGDCKSNSIRLLRRR